MGLRYSVARALVLIFTIHAGTKVIACSEHEMAGYNSHDEWVSAGSPRSGAQTAGFSPNIKIGGGAEVNSREPSLLSPPRDVPTYDEYDSSGEDYSLDMSYDSPSGSSSASADSGDQVRSKRRDSRGD